MKKLSVTAVLGGISILLIIAISATWLLAARGKVELGQYLNLEIAYREPTVTNEEIEAAITRELKQSAAKQTVTQNAQKGDTVVVDYVGKINGAKVDAFCGSDVSLALGEDRFQISGMDSFLMGANTGDTVMAALTVPANFHLAEYVGKLVTYTVEVKSITRLVLPELNMDYVKTKGDYASVEEYKTAFAQQYREDAKAVAKVQLRQQLVYTAVENATVVRYPLGKCNRALTEKQGEIEQEFADFQKEFADMEMGFYDYTSFHHGFGNKQEYDSYLKNFCQSYTKQVMVIKAIAKKEGIKLTQTEYDRLYQQYLAEYKAVDLTEEDMLTQMGGEQGLKEQFLMELVADRLEQTAVITSAE